jgi:hypothetical protein
VKLRDWNPQLFQKAGLRRVLANSFAIVLASFRICAVPPVQFAAPINSPIGILDAIAIVAVDFNVDGILSFGHQGLPACGFHKQTESIRRSAHALTFTMGAVELSPVADLAVGVSRSAPMHRCVLVADDRGIFDALDRFTKYDHEPPKPDSKWDSTASPFFRAVASWSDEPSLGCQETGD